MSIFLLMAGSRMQTSSKLMQRACFPAALPRKADGGSMVMAAALSGLGIPLFMQSIRAAITESFSHSVPNKL
jgi:hypothetical protein